MGGCEMAVELLGMVLADVIPSEVIGGALLAAGLCFTVVYVATLAPILACHIDEL
jgi:putative effector of murein hydrolase LrgA (UPF0299 family)